jgi:hypothetical protein
MICVFAYYTPLALYLAAQPIYLTYKLNNFIVSKRKKYHKNHETADILYFRLKIVNIVRNSTDLR